METTIDCRSRATAVKSLSKHGTKTKAHRCLEETEAETAGPRQHSLTHVPQLGHPPSRIVGISTATQPARPTPKHQHSDTPCTNFSRRAFSIDAGTSHARPVLARTGVFLRDPRPLFHPTSPPARPCLPHRTRKHQAFGGDCRTVKTEEKQRTADLCTPPCLRSTGPLSRCLHPSRRLLRCGCPPRSLNTLYASIPSRR